MTPSAFRVLSGGEEELGLAVECPGCSHTSVNVVSPEHVDVPFYNDRGSASSSTSSRATAARRFGVPGALDSGAFDAFRRDLAA